MEIFVFDGNRRVIIINFYPLKRYLGPIMSKFLAFDTISEAGLYFYLLVIITFSKCNSV